MTNKKIVMLLVLFIGMMTAGRLAWLEHFRLPDAPVAEAGMLDLREWDPLATDRVAFGRGMDVLPGDILVRGLN